MIIEGRVWKFGDNLKSSYFFSGKYDTLGRAHKYEELSRHVLEENNPEFVHQVRSGDIIVVGSAFGTGKHLNGPIGAFRHLGIQAVLGKSFSFGWERDSINLGYPSLVYPEVWDAVETGDVLRLDTRATEATNLTRGKTFAVNPTPKGILDLLDAGGIAGLTTRRLGIVEAGAPAH